METIIFDGQQSDERVLYIVTPHIYAKYLAIARLIGLVILLGLVLVLIASIVPAISSILAFVGVLVSVVLLTTGIWWNQTVYSRSKTYITDRRIIRFDVASPFFQTKRALFWNEALKAKGFAPNLLFRMLNIGTVLVEPHMANAEDVRINDVHYFEDLANYIDKILYTFKNKPTEISLIRPFVPKPRGHRDTA